MIFYVDKYGWYTSEPVGAIYSTDVPPPTQSETTVVGESRATWNGNAWVVTSYFLPPVISEPIPTSITPRQARIVLALQPSPETEPVDWDEQANGAWQPTYPTLLAYVEAQFQALPEPDKTVASITWEYSTEVQRSNPLIAQMQSVIGFTDEQIDELFIQAATL